MIDTASPEVQCALTAVRKAAEVCVRVNMGATLLRITKSDFSPVTVADYAAQAVVARLLESAFPDDRLVGEESSEELVKPESAETLETVHDFVVKISGNASAEQVCAWIDRGTADAGGRFWTLDPLDGTKGYLRGGQYAAALALIEGGEVRLGALACPHLGAGCQPDMGGPGSVVLAVRGEGAWRTPLVEDGEWAPLKMSACADPKQARLLRSHEKAHTSVGQIDLLTKELGVEAEPVLMDSQAKYAVMAAGGGELLFRLLNPKQMDYKEKIWDQAAGSIVVEESGGRITDLDGQSLDFTQGRRLEKNRGVCASNGALHERALEALAAVMDAE